MFSRVSLLIRCLSFATPYNPTNKRRHKYDRLYLAEYNLSMETQLAEHDNVFYEIEYLENISAESLCPMSLFYSIM